MSSWDLENQTRARVDTCVNGIDEEFSVGQVSFMDIKSLRSQNSTKKMLRTDKSEFPRRLT